MSVSPQYLLAVGIQVDQQLLDPAAGTPQHLVGVVQGKVDPCPPSVGPPSVDLPSTCSLGATVMEASGEACGGTEDLEASGADPLPGEGVHGKAAGRQDLLQREGSAWVLGLHKGGMVLVRVFIRESVTELLHVNR